MSKTISLYDAIKRMREYTKAGVPFTFEFMSYNSTKHSTEGIKYVKNAQLRKSMRSDQSNKSKILIGYINDIDKDRWFYLPLLLKFNDYRIKS